MKSLTPSPKTLALTDYSTYELHRRLWLTGQARPSQRTPSGHWNVWLLLAGRGFGKTRTAAEDIAWFGYANPGSRIAVVAETFGDGRDVCVEGDSGLLSVFEHDTSVIANWNRSLGELVLKNGTRYKIYSGDKPDQLRGPQHNRAWLDELAKFQYAKETWDQLMFGLRLGRHPQAVVTTTPRPISVLRDLLDRDDVEVTTGSTFENAPNLSAAALANLRLRYEGTRLGRQELAGELLADVPGALWTRKQIDATRVKEAPDMGRAVVAIDPAVTSGEDADETGIVVAGRGMDGRGYVLADLTCRLSPDGWARRAVQAYEDYSADRIVAEVNNGGDLVQYTLRTISPNIPYKKVTASRGKRVRAEPISALYEQERISHVGSFPELEDQMCTFVPDESTTSPDRVDAMVWAFHELFERRGTRKLRVIR